MLNLMIKKISLLIFLLSTSFFVSQNSIALIKGYVFSDDVMGRKEPIKNVKVKLTTSLGGIQETFTDSMGNYYLRMKNFEGSVELSVSADRSSKTPNMNRSESFMNSKDIRKMELNKADTTIVQNFFLKKAIVCRSMPEITFTFNSCKMIYDTTRTAFENSGEDSLRFLLNIMNDNPSIVVEIAGHCDSREKSDLGLKRAHYVVSELIKKGINPKRLTSKGYGSTKPIVPNAIINAAKSKEEKEALYQKNRRATFKVLNFDFKPE